MYKTTDLYLASYLRAKGFQLQDVEKVGRKATFVFANDENEVTPEMKAFFSGSANVEPLAFVDAIRNMKSIIYNL